MKLKPGLTPTQFKFLLEIFVRTDWGYAPTIRELGDAMGYSSTNAVADVLAVLRRKGAVEPAEHRRQRRIVIAPLGWALLGLKPDSHCVACGAARVKTEGWPDAREP